MSSTSNLRKRLDALIQNGKTIKCSAETTLAWRSLQMAKGWLGKALGYQGTPTPYKVVDSVDKIPPTADVATETFTLTDDHLGNVNAMRDQIQSEIESIEGLMPTEPRQRHCYQKSLDFLTEAGMQYGFEIQELREKAPAPSIERPVVTTTVEEIETKPKQFVVEAVVPPSKNLGNENKGNKEKQQGATGKKG